jgi:hypothetical protein
MQYSDDKIRLFLSLRKKNIKPLFRAINGKTVRGNEKLLALECESGGIADKEIL